MEIIKAKENITGDAPPDWVVWDLDDLWVTATTWTNVNYLDHIGWLRSLSDIQVTPEYFWREYIWCSLVSGFNARIVSSFYDNFLAAIGPDPYITNHNIASIKKVFANEGKITKILACADLIKDMSWEGFHAKYIAPKKIDVLEGLPNVGPVIKHHLARNIGVDTVKPDLHLNRLADHFDFETPYKMCQYLRKKYNVDLIGEVDLRLFLYVQRYGTIALERIVRANTSREDDVQPDI